MTSDRETRIDVVDGVTGFTPDMLRKWPAQRTQTLLKDIVARQIFQETPLLAALKKGRKHGHR